MTYAKPAELKSSALAGENLQLEIAKVISELWSLAALVRALTDSKQTGLSFLTMDARQVQNAMVRNERQQHIQSIILGQPSGRGATAAPGNLAGINVDVELWAVARHQIRRLNKWLIMRKRPAIEAAGDADTRQLLGLLRPLIWDINDDQVLRPVLDDLWNVLEQAQNLVDAIDDDRVHLDTPCPHCGRQTLILTRREGVVTCDKDPHTGKQHTCTCTSNLCECKTRPITYRHSWHRKYAGKPNGWVTFGRLIKNQRNTHQKGTTE